MNKKLKTTLLFILTFTAFSQINAQQYVDSTFIEKFDNNINAWEEKNEQGASSVIENGKYHIEISQEDKNHCLWQELSLDNTADYSIEASMTCTESQNDYCYGLIWNQFNWDNYNTFIVSPQGSLNISATVEGKVNDIVPMAVNSNVNKTGTANTFKLVQKGDMVTFYLNGVEIIKSKKSNFSNKGRWFSFVIYHKKKVDIDNLTIQGRYPKINVIPNAINGYKKENLGKGINSSCYDLGPIISVDGNTLYYFRKTCESNVGGKEGGDDAWISTRNADNSWGDAVNMGFPINNKSNNFVVSVSADNNTLFLGNTYNSDGSPKTTGLSITKRTTTGWSIPEEVIIDNFKNKNMYVNNFLSQDRKILLFAIETDNSRGDLDIYVSLRKEDGSYTEPKNIGDIINTSGTEMSPFLASDNKTLYFASDKHAGYGSFDIFLTRRLDDSWTNWSIPQNLGPEVNSKGGDGYFTLPASGEMAYLSSNENSFGLSDIVRIKLPVTARPEPVVLVKGKVINKKTNEPLEAPVSYHDIVSNKEVGTAISNPKTGEYSIILQSGKKYSFSADKEKFYAINDFLDVSSLKEYKEINKDLLLVPIEVGQTVRLNNIFFDFNKSNIKSDSELELQRLAEFLSKHPGIEIEISGHTDNQGADDYNIKLSQQRVESVMAYLVSKGINKARIVTKGYGKSKPVTTNATEEGRAQNRRVDFTILKQ